MNASLLLTMAILFQAQWAVSDATALDKAEPPALDKGPSYDGRALDYWIRAMKTRDEKDLPAALNAVIQLGPDARKAVPELMQILSKPFAPIAIGSDSGEVVRQKVRDLRLRSNAVDAVAAIGPAAASSARTLAEWALAEKVKLKPDASAVEVELFVNLVGIDILERIRVARAISGLGRDAKPVAQALLMSPNEEERKLGAAILKEEALPLATDLLKSAGCSARLLGLSILTDMWPVVSRSHLLTLNGLMVCEAD